MEQEDKVAIVNKNLNAYRDQAYKIACEHGFHDEHRSSKHLKCLIISELMEAVEADRKGIRANIRDFNIKQIMKKGSKDVKDSFKYNFGICIKDTVEDELADACIRIFDLAGYKDIDLKLWRLGTPVIDQKGTFTENIYNIVRGLVDCEPLNRCMMLTLIRIFLLAEAMGIDIEQHIQLKMEYNASRPYKHGKKY